MYLHISTYHFITFDKDLGMGTYVKKKVGEEERGVFYL